MIGGVMYRLNSANKTSNLLGTRLKFDPTEARTLLNEFSPKKAI